MRLSFCAIIIGLACVALPFAAKADVIYTVTTTGTITFGTSDGTFGANGTSLIGETYTATQTFDATLSTFNQFATKYNYLSPATASASITVGGQTYNIISSTNSSNQYYISSIAGGYDGDEVYAVTSANSSDFSSDIINIPTSTILASDSLSQIYYVAPPNGTTRSSVEFQAPDGTIFGATVSTISLNGGAPPSPAPEPRSATVLVVGLAGLLWLRRRKAPLKPPRAV